MAVDFIRSYLIEKLLDCLPQRLLQRAALAAKIAQRLEIDLRRASPIDICLSRDIPTVFMYFRITNGSPVRLVLERLLVDFWIRQPVLQAALLERYDLPRHTSREDIFLTCHLMACQVAQIRACADGQLLAVPVKIYVKAYFESKAGVLCVGKSLEHRDVPCR